ncbi:serglycin [Centroberyx affinis]|uniref:serglycin n=1 Tax=Centroberyx affinis TaxID=166261 RepID=UPI003A5BD890
MLNMKLIFSLVVACLALNNGMGAPTGRYMFVRCNPSGDQPNCVTHQSPVMALDPDLPSRLPASAAQYMEEEAAPEEEEGPMGDERKMMMATMPLPEEGSGAFEGSAAELPFMADRSFVTGESETGSGESWTEKEAERYQGLSEDPEHMSLELLLDEAKPAEHELREDHLLQL